MSTARTRRAFAERAARHVRAAAAARKAALNQPARVRPILRRRIKLPTSKTQHQERCEFLLNDPTASSWLKFAIADLERRDPLDALRDAEILVELQQARFAQILIGEPS